MKSIKTSENPLKLQQSIIIIDFTMQRLPIDISPKMDLYFRRFFTAWLIDHLDDGINISRSESDGKLCLSQVEDRYRNFIVEIIFSIKISFYTQSRILKKYFISFIFTNLLRIYVRISFISRTGDDLHTRHSYYCFLLSFHLPGAGFENIIDCLNFPLIERICHTGLNKMYPR